MGPGARLTIDQLAQRTGMTARNIRAHQSRGLLPAPELEGRTGFYDAEHVARLELIRDMQASGFNLGAIKKLLDAAPVGSAADLLRFERAVMAPWEKEGPQILEAAELARMLGGDVTPTLVERAIARGVIDDLGDGRYEVPSPSLLRAGAQVVSLGIPVERVIEVLERLMAHAEGVARVFVELFLDDVWKPFESAGSPEEDWPRVSQALEQLRPLASEVLLAAFHRAMTRAVEQAFGERLAGPVTTDTPNDDG